MDGHGEVKKGNKRLLYALLLASVTIAFGLAIGLAIGLRSPPAMLKKGPNGKKDQQPCPTLPPTQQPTTPPPAKQKSVVGRYRHGAVAADSAICSEIGSDIIVLQKGSAVDGAIAALICNSVANPHSMGTGGGFFMTVYNRTSREARALDSREAAPLSASEDMFIPENVSSTVGGLAIGVPGEVKGYKAAHAEYGKLPWSTLFQPTIKLCEDGVPVSKEVFSALNEDHIKTVIGADPAWSMYYPNGNSVQVGDKVKLPKLAETFKKLANDGPDTFYTGNLANDIIADITDKGGIITLADLIAYKPIWKTPVNITLRDGLAVYSVPPPSSGVVYEYILNILDGYDFTPDDMSTDAKAILTLHRIIESMKYAYAKRTNIGDERFVDMQELIANLTSNEFGESIRQQIDDSRTYDTMHYGPTFYDKSTTGTSHLSALDMDGNAVSVTSTINLHFGSLVKGARSGIVFNNQMDDFSTPNLTNSFGIEPSPANFIKPEKRPLSSMCPAVIVNGEGDVVLIAGASGGSKITTSTALISMLTLRLGFPLGKAEDFERIHHQLLPKEIQAEPNVPKVYLDGLKALGHDITFYKPGLVGSSAVQAILVKDKHIYAVSDKRKGGIPAGF